MRITNYHRIADKLVNEMGVYKLRFFVPISTYVLLNKAAMLNHGPRFKRKLFFLQHV